MFDVNIAILYPSERLKSLPKRSDAGLHLGIMLGKCVQKQARRIRSACCARAVSGHAAAPPSSVMNSRRLSSGRDVRFIARPPHRTVRAAFPNTAPSLGV